MCIRDRIKPWAKLLMMLEAACSIVLAALVIARAIREQYQTQGASQ